MPATATIAAGLGLTVPAPTGTANDVHLRTEGGGTLSAATNTIAQIAVPVTDGITGDPLTIQIALMAAESSVTVDTGTDKIALAAHGFAEGQPVQFTAATLPAPLVAGQLYYVTTPATNDFKVSATVGGTPENLTTAGSAVKVRPFGALTLSYPYGAPAAPVEPRQQFTGEVNDFTRVRAVQVIYQPLDPDASASGRAQLTMGDETDRYAHFALPLELDFTAGGDPLWPSWVGTLPAGLSYDTANHLTLRIAPDEGNANGLILINLLGN